MCYACKGIGQSHWHEHGTVVRSTQLGDTVQEDGGHLLVLVLDEAEHFEGKAAHLALPVFKDCRLGVFLTASHRERGVKSSLRITKGGRGGGEKKWQVFAVLHIKDEPSGGSYLKKRS